MIRNHYLPILFCLLLQACLPAKKNATAQAPGPVFETELDSLNFFDASRNRLIPLAVYRPKTDQVIPKQKVVLLSHGYGANAPGACRGYSYLTRFLAAQGYFVVSIQHELPTDSLLPQEGKPQVVRRSNWERGAANILFVLNELKRQKPNLDYAHLTLIGHSNGGDQTMLFAQQYPDLVDKAISLDNRRMALPRTRHPHIYSLRADEFAADEGVLPTPEEQKQYGITVITLKNTRHSDMSDLGNEAQHREINGYILNFLKH